MGRKQDEPQNTLLRQWTMLREIPRAPRTTSTQELQRRLAGAGFDVDIRTIQRDLNSLTVVLPLQGDGSKPQSWSWLPRAGQFDIPGLQVEAALAFFMAEGDLRNTLPPSAYEALQPWFRLARDQLDAHGGGLSKWRKKIRVLPRGLQRTNPPITEEVQDAVYSAVLKDRKLRVTYARSYPKNDERGLAPHVISPMALVVRDGMIYLVCRYDGFEDVRQLALHRIRSAEILDEPALPIGEFSIDEYIAQGEFGITLDQKPVRLEARFRRGLEIYLREASIATNQVLSPVDDEFVLLTATVPNTLELRLWLRSFGDGVVVVKPTRLRNEFRDQAQRLAEAYGAA